MGGPRRGDGGESCKTSESTVIPGLRNYSFTFVLIIIDYLVHKFTTFLVRCEANS